MARQDDHDRNSQREDLPGPAEDPDTSLIGSTDKRSSENRRKGLQREEENAREGEGSLEDDEGR